MTNLLGELQRWFESEGWSVTLADDGEYLVTGYAGEHGPLDVVARVRPESSQILVYSRPSFHVAEEHRSNMAELLTRANYGLLIGNFEMDMDDGELRYKTSMVVADNDLQDVVIGRQLVEPNVTTMDRYLPAMLAMLYGGYSPIDALARVEG